jgi:hypothetical protein
VAYCLLIKVYRDAFPRVKISTDLLLLPRLIMCGSRPLSLQCLHGVDKDITLLTPGRGMKCSIAVGGKGKSLEFLHTYYS